jgi:hypothetical protein
MSSCCLLHLERTSIPRTDVRMTQRESHQWRAYDSQDSHEPVVLAGRSLANHLAAGSVGADRNTPCDTGRVMERVCAFSARAVAGLHSKRTSESPNASWES